MFNSGIVFWSSRGSAFSNPAALSFRFVTLTAALGQSTEILYFDFLEAFLERVEQVRC